MKSFNTRLLLLSALSLLATSCSRDDDYSSAPRPNARVMVVHASPNAPVVDVRLNNKVALTNVAFPANSGYNDVESGPVNIKVSPAGTTNYVLDVNGDLQANTNYSVFAVDSVSKIKASVVVDNLTAPAAGKAHVRFFHLSPDAPPVSIAVAGSTQALFANRSFNDQSSNAALSAFTPVDAGTYNLEVRLASNNSVVLPVNGVVLQAGKIYTVFARGFAGGTGNQALGAQVIVHN